VAWGYFRQILRLVYFAAKPPQGAKNHRGALNRQAIAPLAAGYMRLFLLRAAMLVAVCFFAGQATAGSAIVVASNGVYASAWGPVLSAEGAAGKATELCQKKGGIDIKVLASAGSVSASSGGRLFGAIAASGHGQSAIVGFSFRSHSGPGSEAEALAMCRAKGGTNPRIVVAWFEQDAVNGVMPGTRAGKF
jgi:hypothetical protein